LFTGDCRTSRKGQIGLQGQAHTAYNAENKRDMRFAQ
jgi:hypothetical protein